MIYLVSNTKFLDERVKWLTLCKIKFLKFEISILPDALVFTSKNALKALTHNQIKFPQNTRIYAIGEACASACKKGGYSKIYTARNSHGDEFAREISPFLRGKNVLFVSAKERVSHVDEILRESGAHVTHIIGYENVEKMATPELKPERNSIIIFASPKNAQSFIKNFGWDESFKAVCIGESTAEILRNFTTPIVSETQSIKTCVDLATCL